MTTTTRFHLTPETRRSLFLGFIHEAVTSEWDDNYIWRYAHAIMHVPDDFEIVSEGELDLGDYDESDERINPGICVAITADYQGVSI